MWNRLLPADVQSAIPYLVRSFRAAQGYEPFYLNAFHLYRCVADPDYTVFFAFPSYSAVCASRIVRAATINVEIGENYYLISTFDSLNRDREISISRSRIQSDRIL